MLNRELSIERFGNDTKILSDKSSRMVVANCDNPDCLAEREVQRNNYCRYCPKCAAQINADRRKKNKKHSAIRKTSGFSSGSQHKENAIPLNPEVQCKRGCGSLTRRTDGICFDCEDKFNEIKAKYRKDRGYE